MKLILIAGLTLVSALVEARICKMEMYAPNGQFITSIRTPNDFECLKTIRSCRNWKEWYYVPSESRCYRVQDDGYAIIDYVRYPNYDEYYGYPGSPYHRVPRVPQTRPQPNPQTGRRVCEWVNGAELCWTVNDPEPRPRPDTRPNPRPDTRPNPTPRPDTRPTPNPDPVPTPNPNPNPGTTPAPTPAPSNDAIRPIEAGETVIFNSALHMVVSVASENFYNVKPINGRNREVVKDVARHYVAVTRGCNVGFCANDSVIIVGSASYAAIAGLEYDGQFVIKTVDGRETMTFDVNASAMAWTKGCSPEGPRKVCIGNVVMRSARNNAYFTVVGIQLDGKVVIENNDGQKKLTTNVAPESLIITR